MAPLSCLLSGIYTHYRQGNKVMPTHGKRVERARASSSTDRADWRLKLPDLLDMSFHFPHLQKKEKIVLVYKTIAKHK